MNVLSIVKEVASIVGASSPQTLFDKNDAQSVLFLSLLKDALQSLKRFGHWQQLQKEGMFYIHEAESVYPLKEIAPDFFTLIKDTIYIKDKKEKVIGSVSPEQFMYSKYFETSGKEAVFYIRQNAFCFLKTPPVGSKIVFQYQTNNIVMEEENQTTNPTFKQEVTKDTDIPLFDEYLIKLALIWRWYKRNALPYEAEYQEYLTEVKKSFSETQSLKNISLAGDYFFYKEGDTCHVRIKKHL